MSKYYGKIWCEEGVIKEREFATHAEAEAYSSGALDMLEAADPGDDVLDDTLAAGVGTEPARDPDEPQPEVTPMIPGN